LPQRDNYPRVSTGGALKSYPASELMFDSWLPRAVSSPDERTRPILELIADLQRLLFRDRLVAVTSSAIHCWTIQVLVFALASVTSLRALNRPAAFLELAAKSSDWGSRIFRDDQLWPLTERSLGAVARILIELDRVDLIEAIAVALDYGRTLEWLDDGKGMVLTRDLTTAKVQGVFYTPPAIADYLAAKVIDGSTVTCPRICDPAVGSGRFLIAAARRLLLQYPANVVRTSLYGVDTDPVAVEAAALMLDALTDDWRPGERPPSLHCRLVCGDSFGGPLTIGDGPPGAINWATTFPSIFAGARPGFDAVLINPPFGRYKVDSDWLVARDLRLDPKSLKHLKRQTGNSGADIKSSGFYTLSTNGVLDKSRIGLERATQITREGGRLGAVLPSTIAADSLSFKLREHLLREWNTEEIVEFPENARLFYDVSQSVCTVVATKGMTTNAIWVRSGIRTPLDLRSAPSTKWPIELIEKMSPRLAIPLRGASSAAIVELMQKWSPLGEWSQIVNARGEVDLTVYRDALTSNSTHTPLVRGDQIDRYRLDLPSEKAAFVKTEPLFRRLASSQKLSHLKRPRLVGRQCSYLYRPWRLSFAFVLPNNAVANSCNYLSGQDEDRLLYLLAFINSELMNWRFKLSNSNNHVANSELDEFPIPMPEQVPSDIRHRLVELVREVHHQFDQNKLNEIDEHVYDIYRLRPSHRKKIRSDEGAGPRVPATA